MQHFDHFFQICGPWSLCSWLRNSTSSLRLCMAAPDSWNLFQDGWSLKRSAAWSQPMEWVAWSTVLFAAARQSRGCQMMRLNASTRNRCDLIDAVNWEISFLPSWLAITVNTSMLFCFYSFFFHDVFLVLSVQYQLKVAARWPLDRLWPTLYPLKKAHNQDCIS